MEEQTEMKIGIFAAGVVAGICILSSGIGQKPVAAQPANELSKIASLAREMDENAAAASRNAEIYQWVRVNHEVDRVVAGEHRLAQLLPANKSASATAQALPIAVQELRAARLARDPARTRIAAKHVIEACQPLE